MTLHFRTLLDLNESQLISVLDRAAEMKRERVAHTSDGPLSGKSVVILLEKASTRTRLSFEIGISELGGYPTTLISRDTQLGRGEPISDTARVLSGYAHAVVYRTFAHGLIEELAAHSSIPIINGLSDDYHPCQLLADLQTVREQHGPDLKGLKVAWIGDGNNMAHSWILAAARTGLDLRLGCPEGYLPKESIVDQARILGAKVQVFTDPKKAAEGARVVTTDVWASMGQEEENVARKKAFADFQVNGALMSIASDDAIFLHCLPAHRGEEVSAEVMDGPASRVWAEAENRLHAQKALLEYLITQS